MRAVTLLLLAILTSQGSSTPALLESCTSRFKYLQAPIAFDEAPAAAHIACESPAQLLRGGGFQRVLANENLFFTTHGAISIVSGVTMLVDVRSFFRLTSFLNGLVGQSFSKATAHTAAISDPAIYKLLGAAVTSMGITDLLSAQSVDDGFRRSMITLQTIFSALVLAVTLYSWVVHGNSQYASTTIVAGVWGAWANYLLWGSSHGTGPKAQFY